MDGHSFTGKVVIREAERDGAARQADRGQTEDGPNGVDRD